MQVSGLVVDAETNAPIEEARVVITRENGGDEIAAVLSSRQGRFAWSDQLNEYLGQSLAFSVTHHRYRAFRAVHAAAANMVVTLAISPDSARVDPVPRGPGLLARLRRWFQGLGRRAWLALGGVALLLGGLVLTLMLDRGGPGSMVCELSDIRRVAASGQPSTLFELAELCGAQGKGELRFAAIEQCALREHGPCLMTMAGWYDPRQAAEPSPFRERNPVLATEYYRRARNQGVEDARPQLDALCQSLRQQGGSAAAEAVC